MKLGIAVAVLWFAVAACGCGNRTDVRLVADFNCGIVRNVERLTPHSYRIETDSAFIVVRGWSHRVGDSVHVENMSSGMYMRVGNDITSTMEVTWKVKVRK